MKRLQLLLTVIVAGFLFTQAAAQEIELIEDVHGFAWESGAFPPSIPGDELCAVGTAASFHPSLPVDPANFSYTWHVRDVVSIEEYIFNTTRVVFYSGGRLSIHVDALPSNHDYGVDPPNATVPSTFTDGLGVLLEGEITDFILTWNTASHAGSCVGTVTFTGGDGFEFLPWDPVGWTFGWDLSMHPTPPTGYDLAMSGAVYFPLPDSTEPSSWGAIKALYR